MNKEVVAKTTYIDWT